MENDEETKKGTFIFVPILIVLSLYCICKICMQSPSHYMDNSMSNRTSVNIPLAIEIIEYKINYEPYFNKFYLKIRNNTDFEISNIFFQILLLDSENNLVHKQDMIIDLLPKTTTIKNEPIFFHGKWNRYDLRTDMADKLTDKQIRQYRNQYLSTH